MKYNANETMIFLGKQYYNNYVSKEQYNQLQDIKKACFNDREIDLDLMLADAYILGYIAGQRAERARKHKKGCNTQYSIHNT